MTDDKRVLLCIVVFFFPGTNNVNLLHHICNESSQQRKNKVFSSHPYMYWCESYLANMKRGVKKWGGLTFQWAQEEGEDYCREHANPSFVK